MLNLSLFHKSEIRTVLLEVGIDLGLLKKALLKTSKIILMCSNSLARQFSSMFHAKCLLPRLDELLPVRSCLQNFYQCVVSSVMHIAQFNQLEVIKSQCMVPAIFLMYQVRGVCQ